MASRNGTQKTLGALEAGQEDLHRRMGEVEKKLDSVLESLAETKGGRRVLMGLLAASGAFGGILGALVHKLWP